MGKLLFVNLIFFSLFLTGCSDDEDWIKWREFILDEEKAIEIIEQTSKSNEFKDGSATKLPIGTKLYSVIERKGIYIAIVKGEQVIYSQQREG